MSKYVKIGCTSHIQIVLEFGADFEALLRGLLKHLLFLRQGLLGGFDRTL